MNCARRYAALSLNLCILQGSGTDFRVDQAFFSHDPWIAYRLRIGKMYINHYI